MNHSLGSGIKNGIYTNISRKYWRKGAIDHLQIFKLSNTGEVRYFRDNVLGVLDYGAFVGDSDSKPYILSARRSLSHLLPSLDVGVNPHAGTSSFIASEV